MGTGGHTFAMQAPTTGSLALMRYLKARPGARFASCTGPHTPGVCANGRTIRPDHHP